MAAPGDLRQRPQLVQRINRAQLRRLGQADHARFGIMNVRPPVDCMLDGLRVYLPVGARQQQQLGAIGEKLRAAALGGFDVRQFVAENAVVGLAQRRQRKRVGRRAVKDEKHLAVGLEDVANQVGRLVGPGIVSITDFVTLVGLRHGGEGFRTNTGIIVAGKLATGSSFCIHRRHFSYPAAGWKQGIRAKLSKFCLRSGAL